MAVTCDCAEGRHDVCRGAGPNYYCPQSADMGDQKCACGCHRAESDQAPSAARMPKSMKIPAREVGDMLEGLTMLYTNEGVGLWLKGRKKSLGGRTPIQAIREGDFDDVCGVINQMITGAHS